MRFLRRWELRSRDLGSGMTEHVSWHTREATAYRAQQYWMDRVLNNDGAREDIGIRYYYLREVKRANR